MGLLRLTYTKLQSPKDTPLLLLALLLLALPELFTLQKLLVLPELGDRSHQLFAEQARITGLDPYLKTYAGRFLNLSLSAFFTLAISFASSTMYSPNSCMAWSIQGHFSGFWRIAS